MTGKLMFIGLGLWDENDMTLNALNEARSCNHIFAEMYTSYLFGTTKDKIQQLIGKPITFLPREIVENEEEIINVAKKESVAFLTVGDPMTATTHLSLRLRAINEGIPTKILHGISIVTAAASETGLQIYKFGRTTTLAFPQKDYLPESPYHVIGQNIKQGLHSLILLDIVTEEERYMDAHTGIQLLLKMEKKNNLGFIHKNTLMVVVARAASPTMMISANYPHQLLKKDYGLPLHSLIIPGKLHLQEATALVKIAEAPRDILENI
jgi:diphthine synthase